MKKIWAPWRMEYIRKIDKSTCIFCYALKKEDDRESLILNRGMKSFIIMNRFPYNPGHLMVAPNRHIGDFKDLSDDEIVELIRNVDEAIRILREKMSPEGFNLGINLGRVAGAGVEGHLHIHIVPRWQGDTNFMPIIGEAKVISESLRDTYELLKSD
ncbi:MAG TPA: HIT domain-containing protein [bacterium (Candidatus Stahlbacteria)]|nr:HIT domain-containing protein [Candidatus Stahlbacteria bacterium]